MSSPITVVIVDDHVLFRSGLRELLQQEEVHVIGEASTAEAGLELVQRHAPDVAIMDLNLPAMSGHDAIRRIVESAPSTQVLVLTISANESDVTDAVLAGACGYLLKDASVADIVTGVRAAAADESMISPRMTKTLLDRLRRQERTDGKPPAGTPLHPRAGDPTTRDRGQGQCDDRARAVHQPLYGQEPHLEHPAEAPRLNRIQAAVLAVRDSLL